MPLDPISVVTTPSPNCIIPDVLDPTVDFNANPQPVFRDVLDSLPDQFMRVAFAQYNDSGALVFIPIGVGFEGRTYQVTLDYVQVDTVYAPFVIDRHKATRPIGDAERRAAEALLEWGNPPSREMLENSVSIYDDTYKGPTRYRIQPAYSSEAFEQKHPRQKMFMAHGENVLVPVYIGVGLRLTARIQVKRGSVDLSSLTNIGAEAKAGKVAGNFEVQTLGITGKQVAQILPMPSELTQSSINDAIKALRDIKSILYADGTQIEPRVVGIKNAVGGGEQVTDGIASALSNYRITWVRPCRYVQRPPAR